MRIGLNMSLTGAGAVSPLALYALGGLTPFFVNDADSAKYLDDLTGNKNLHDVWDNARTGAATCIDSDGSLKWGLHNLVDTRLNDGGQWTPTGVTVDTVDTAVEFITNGTYDTDISGWVAAGSGTLTWSSGEIDVSSPGSYIGRAEQSVLTEVGKTYRVSVGYTGGSDEGRVNVRENGGAFSFINGLTSSSTSAEDLSLIHI